MLKRKLWCVNRKVSTEDFLCSSQTSSEKISGRLRHEQVTLPHWLVKLSDLNLMKRDNKVRIPHLLVSLMSGHK